MSGARPPVSAYLPVLRAIARCGKYVVIGSFGLALVLPPGVLERPPSDADLVLRSQRDLEAAVAVLEGRGWELRVWGEPLPRLPEGPPDLDALSGQTYVRARVDALQLDLVFEPPEPGFDWARLSAGAVEVGGVPVASLETLLALNEASRRPHDRALAASVRARLGAGRPTG